MVDHLTSIALDTHNRIWSESTVEQATKLKKFLKNKHVIALIAFNLDVQVVFLGASKEFQKKHSSIVGQLDRRIYLEDQLNAYKNVDGGYNLLQLVANSYCLRTQGQVNELLRNPNKAGSRRKCRSLEEYETSHVVYEGHYIEDNDSTYEVVENKEKKEKKFAKLSSVKSDYIDRIVKNVEIYFPMKLLDAFAVFNQNDWDETKAVEIQQRNADGSLRQLSEFYGIPYENDIYKSWLEVVKRAMESDPWCRTKDSSPMLFWMKVLSLKDLVIHPKLKKLIQSSIVTPLGNFLIIH